MSNYLIRVNNEQEARMAADILKYRYGVYENELEDRHYRIACAIWGINGRTIYTEQATPNAYRNQEYVNQHIADYKDKHRATELPLYFSENEEIE